MRKTTYLDGAPESSTVLSLQHQSWTAQLTKHHLYPTFSLQPQQVCGTLLWSSGFCSTLAQSHAVIRRQAVGTSRNYSIIHWRVGGCEKICQLLSKNCLNFNAILWLNGISFLALNEANLIRISCSHLIFHL